MRPFPGLGLLPALLAVTVAVLVSTLAAVLVSTLAAVLAVLRPVRPSQLSGPVLAAGAGEIARLQGRAGGTRAGAQAFGAIGVLILVGVHPAPIPVAHLGYPQG
ncbi:hypothetical protein ACIQ7Q_06435 [Streptomyces sp. NPDC096176]|uniref:hypothetical protein n=1 Tax=Streptomyces sp. NPDC096176 TaxID=3366079 RepID=UPI003821475F